MVSRVNYYYCLLLLLLREQALNHFKAPSFFYPSTGEVIYRRNLNQEGQIHARRTSSPPPRQRSLLPSAPPRPTGLPGGEAAAGSSALSSHASPAAAPALIPTFPRDAA